MKRTSSGSRGLGFDPAPADPTNPVTPGVFLTTYHDSSVMINSTNTYPGNVFFTSFLAFPSLT